MKKLVLNKEYGTIENYRNLINDSINSLKLKSKENEKKIVEICHLGKFLMFFDNKIKIYRVQEKPDFILKRNEEFFGLEHQILVKDREKEKEGIIQNYFKLAETDLNNKDFSKKFLANITIQPFFETKGKNKKATVKEIIRLIKSYLETGKLRDNEIIQEISIMPHSKISLCPNFGGWWQRDLNAKILKEAIYKKEEKLIEYKRNHNLPQWLLIVIGSLDESSYEIGNIFEFTADSKFDKIYILEDFRTNLYEIK